MPVKPASTTEPGASGRRRAVSKEVRRQQLIDATIKCIARKGLSNTTMADVTTAARLSQGIVNLHFQSKQGLLTETLRFLAYEYKAGWDSVLGAPALTPAQRIAALIRHDFSPAITHPNKLAVWFAFWGESSSRPTYSKICKEADLQATSSMRDLCAELAGGSRVNVDLIATGYTALADGLWLDLLVTPQDMDRQTALAICEQYMASFFPEDFPLRQND